MAQSPSIFSPPNKKWPLLNQSAFREWSYLLRCFSLLLDAFRALSPPTPESRVSLLDELYHYTRLAESVTFDGKSLSPIVFRLCNHFFLEFLGVMFRLTPIPRTVHHMPLIFSRHILYHDQILHSCIILPSLVPFSTLRYSSRTTPRTSGMHATLNWNLASRYCSWPKLLRITAYLYRFLNRL